MKQTVDITITADVPDDADDDLGHEGVVQTKEAVAAVVAVLTKLGFRDVKASRRIYKRKAAADTATLPKPRAVLPAA